MALQLYKGCHNTGSVNMGCHHIFLVGRPWTKLGTWQQSNQSESTLVNTQVN